MTIVALVMICINIIKILKNLKHDPLYELAYAICLVVFAFVFNSFLIIVNIIQKKCPKMMPSL